MTVVQTVLVFVGIPLLVALLLALFVYGKSLLSQPNRYRPGKAWDYEPKWFIPHPEALATTHVPVKSGGTIAVGGASGEW